MAIFCIIVAATAQMAASPAGQAGQAPNRSFAPAAAGLFERDWVLMNWALKRYDKDGDFKLSPAETAAAAAEFRRLADADDNGRVTRAEYRAARQFTLARY